MRPLLVVLLLAGALGAAEEDATARADKALATIMENPDSGAFARATAGFDEKEFRLLINRLLKEEWEAAASRARKLEAANRLVEKNLKNLHGEVETTAKNGVHVDEILAELEEQVAALRAEVAALKRKVEQ